MTLVISLVKPRFDYQSGVAKERVPELIVSGVVRLLREERLRQGISMNTMAQRTGLSQSTISLIERDLRNPTLESLLKIAEVMKIDLGAFLSKVKSRTSKPE